MILRHTRFLCTAAAAILTFVGCSSDNPSKPGKWIVLFDGKQPHGLRGYKQEAFPDKAWVVDNGTLKTVSRQQGGQPVDLMTQDKFRDFELSLEWKVPPGGNSGIIYKVAETAGPAWHTGFEMQILDDSGHKDGQNPRTSAGALYALIAPNASKKSRPPGEFNEARLVVRGSKVEHWLNGSKIVEYDQSSETLKALISLSKFKDKPDFGKITEGHVAIQHHGEEVWFRNIKIRPL